MTSDPTFAHYSSTQASAYAQLRHGTAFTSSSSRLSTSYPPALYSYILSHHSRTGGRLGVLLDVGCGPGNVARDLAPHFERTIGIDPGEAMVREARRLTEVAEAEGEAKAAWKAGSVTFAVGDAGRLADMCRDVGVEEDSVDLIVAGMAAHWFPMREFYTSVSSLLRPSSGTLAFWTCASAYVHPTRTPSASALQDLFSHFEDTVVGSFALPGNRLSRSLYADLPMPWTVDPPVTGLPRETFVRQTWNEDGKIPEGQDGFFFGKKESLGRFLASLGTSSMVTRWREANAKKPAGEREEDCVEVLGRRSREILGSEGNEVELEGGVAVVVVMGKKAEKE